MKTRIIAFLSLLIFSGCVKDVLDKSPLDRISDNEVWESKQLVEYYLVSLYDALPIGFQTDPSLSLSNISDESAASRQNSVNDFGNSGLLQNTAMYSSIRKANYFIDRIKTSSLPDADKTALTAECRFIRAYYYFDLVKKYGGMPIINEVQSFNGDNLAALKVPRNKEDEVYEYILAEIDAVITDLPDTRIAAESNRATKSVALALKSRAMLYAGSIARYGKVQLNGLIGIPAENAGKYYSESVSASKAIIANHIFSLYNKYYNPVTKVGDPTKNYQNIFLDKNNSEVIFQKAYNFPDKGNSYDYFNIPYGYTTTFSSCIVPTLELVESYEYVDGSNGKLNITNKEFSSADELYKNKDPRFEASILRSDGAFPVRPASIYRGIYDLDGTLYENLAPFPKDPAKRQVGLDGPWNTGEYSKTGFYIKKYINTNTLVTTAGYSDQNYIDFRYAEILLNYAEAAFETGTDLPQALDAINQIRSRAGINLLNSAELTIARIRNERKVELAFEDKRFWDMRRWRIGTEIFSNKSLHGLWPYLKYKSPGVYTYIFTAVSGFPIDQGIVRIFNERDYYSNLANYISTNPNIINNPGY